MLENIVVLLDGSELAEHVLPHVEELVRDRDVRVHLLSVGPVPRGPAPPAPGGGEGRRSRIERDLKTYLNSVALRLGPIASEVRVSVRLGLPADEILGYVSDVAADFVAMSTHGWSGLSQWAFGTVADRVLQGATCPVLVVRAGAARSAIPNQRILVPLDGSALAEQIVPHVEQIIRPNQTQVFLLSVMMSGLGDRAVSLMRSSPPGLWFPTNMRHLTEVQLQSYLRSVALALRDRGAVVQIAVRHGSPASEILAYATQIQADLIGMTSHGLSGLSHWVYGGVARKVVQGAHRHVLLVRPVPDEETS